jgi:membrane protease subunit (stomatin/prohibitin family)
MGLGDFIKKQFVDIIHYTEDVDGVLGYRFPMQDFEIQYGAQLTVRESQAALFVNEGQVADVFMEPGRYRLTTQTLPVLTYLQNWGKLFESPFKSDVYFYSLRLQLNRKWGTPNPITIRDKEFGAVRLRAFGIYTYKISDPGVFYKRISGTRAVYTVEDLDDQLRNTIVSSITDMFGESAIPFLDMAANQDEFGAAMKDTLAGVFDGYGLALDAIQVQNISLPEELQKYLDQRIGMDVVGDMRRVTQFQTAQSIPIAAANEGGIAGAGAGLGAGMTIGQAMTSAITGASQAGQPAGEAAEDIPALLERLHGLFTKGIITQEEFDAKKAELLKKIK